MWTEDELARGRVAYIQRYLKAGFTWSENGLLCKGEGKRRVEVRPGCDLPVRQPWDPLWNPRTDATAVRMGAPFISPNRYGPYANGNYLDANGTFLDPDACPECGSLHGEARFFVRAQSRNPFAPPWQQAWTYCRRCCTPEEIAKLKAPR